MSVCMHLCVCLSLCVCVCVHVSVCVSIWGQVGRPARSRESPDWCPYTDHWPAPLVSRRSVASHWSGHQWSEGARLSLVRTSLVRGFPASYWSGHQWSLGEVSWVGLLARRPGGKVYFLLLYLILSSAFLDVLHSVSRTISTYWEGE